LINIPNPADTPMLTLEQAARIMGIGRTTAYTLAKKDALPVPVVRVGSLYRLPTAPLLSALGLLN
jgi:excisionase family DNA binding protein